MSAQTDKQIAKLIDANNQTNNRQVYWDVDTIPGDETGNKTAAMQRRLATTYRHREQQMVEIASRAITGKSWQGFLAQHSEGFRHGYTPSVSTAEHGELTAHVLSTEFEGVYGRPMYLY